MPKVQTGNKTYDDACAAAETTRQAAVAAATTQTAINSAEVTYYKALRDSARTNNLPSVGDLNTVIRQLNGVP